MSNARRRFRQQVSKRFRSGRLKRIRRINSARLIFEHDGIRRPFGILPEKKRSLRRKLAKQKSIIGGKVRRGKEKSAERMRKEPTHWEWLAGRILDEAGITFIPQHIVRGYIVDIAIPVQKLAIELDGRWHLTPARIAYDKRRTSHLAKDGWRVVRFLNSEIRDDRTSRERFLARVRSA